MSEWKGLQARFRKVADEQRLFLAGWMLNEKGITFDDRKYKERQTELDALYTALCKLPEPQPDFVVTLPPDVLIDDPGLEDIKTQFGSARVAFLPFGYGCRRV